MRKALFIGGPADGTTRIIEDHMREIQIPVLTEYARSLGVFPPDVDPFEVRPKYEAVTYYRQSLPFLDGYVFALLPSIPIVELLVMLVEGYPDAE